MTFSVDDLIATAQARTMEVRVCARGDLVNKHQELVEHLNDVLTGPASLGGNKGEKEAAEAILAVEAEMESSTISFVMTAVSRRQWADTLAEAVKAGEDGTSALVALCCKEPGLTAEQAAKLYDTLPPAEWEKLEGAARELNTRETPHPKLPAASALVQQSDSSSTTADPEASPEAGSSDESGDQ